MRLGVVGSPIAHSKSPFLQKAAFGVLGLRWEYTAEQVERGSFADHVQSLDARWRGLSVTAPLKEEAHQYARELDDDARLTGAVNTLLLKSRRGFNTDVDGIVRAFGTRRVTTVRRAAVIGGGSTAASALVALARMGATAVEVRLRTVAKGESLRPIADELGVELLIDDLDAPVERPDAVVSTLPSSAAVTPTLVRPGAILDADYARGTSRYDFDHEDRVISGLEMLAAQALTQVKIFVGGAPDRELPNEARVYEAMRASIGLA
ncbi:shikimate dehydrogenase family protein [Agrococcus casei]|uniref:shikimate dehydrogenase family protein n=1 Tax=Agrococcus casei TaxID=343512 RepID=UPI003F93D527